MINRIQQLMKTYQLSAADLADTLGTERSGISHFLSGRNKPSLAFVTKLLERFPDVSPDWLIMGIGSMLRTEKQTASAQVVEPQQQKMQPEKKPAIYNQPEKQFAMELHDEDPVSYGSKSMQKEIKQAKKEPMTPAAEDDDNQIERIVIFYNDHSFQTYKMR